MQSQHKPLGRHVVVGISSLTLTREEERFLQKMQPSGVILFSRNIQEPNQLQALISTIRERISPFCSIWIDQEGGRVQRLRDPFTRFPSPWRLARLAMQTPEDAGSKSEPFAVSLARIAGQICGAELASMGIGINCAPVLDIREEGADPVIGERAFGDSPERVITLARAWLAGLKRQGIMAVGKHFPGHGAALVDSHKSLPTIHKSRAELERWELQPFKQLMPQLPAMMTAHLVAHGLGKTEEEAEPATCCQTLLQGLLRQSWGYQGLIVSDALEMGALSGTLQERAYRSIYAGCDLVLCCTGKLEDSAATLEGASKALEAMPSRQRQQIDQRVADAIKPYCLPPGDWQALLQQTDYRQARYLLETMEDDRQQADPTEFSPVADI